LNAADYGSFYSFVRNQSAFLHQIGGAIETAFVPEIAIGDGRAVNLRFQQTHFYNHSCGSNAHRDNRNSSDGTVDRVGPTMIGVAAFIGSPDFYQVRFLCYLVSALRLHMSPRSTVTVM
jgi:hypothetical protein